MSFNIACTLRRAAFVAACGMLAHGAMAQPAPMTAPQPKPDATLEAAPAGFDVRRANVPSGSIERIEFDSSVTGGKRPATVYLPPGYSADREYPVLYLLHGIGGNETHWTTPGAADAILDNLIADGKAQPMIVVMPNGRASNEPVTAFGPPPGAQRARAECRSGRPRSRHGRRVRSLRGLRARTAERLDSLC
jgi:hypothetical protein